MRTLLGQNTLRDGGRDSNPEWLPRPTLRWWTRQAADLGIHEGGIPAADGLPVSDSRLEDCGHFVATTLRYNSILNEAEEVRNFRLGRGNMTELQCFSVQTTMGMKIDRSIDSIQTMVRPTRQPHLLMWVNDARWATGTAEGSHLPNAVDTWVKILRGSLQPEEG